ncbi:23S rRNA (cytidine1920-2'-O)/16S rRNA (cytidine1409-2'-O)-methyltransferase [Desulfobaculum xiamenense]|uniref:23S rRNA (Cytidine1920-2'-O)/16S rRNA (Cytidine1409-2'-O)-methyltransferase n=1 Tax=Desulfobaculum xiamenense TaxID=995050 RepID=A0A846QLF4_9BACT|nr:TlyA family RNA methyltransferase [Desulfobaculum xiamenense]NJB67013.1 23S rRNA (cytidine1920-2'-O)/16S rRNA (cytidine1409-2'-O)-methyltransferase [Desulfobaculum xiamenense]
MAKNRIRADQLLYEQGLVESKEKAERLIMAGQVFVERVGCREPVTKPGQQLSQDDELSLKGVERFVSRGAYKLLTAIEHFGLSCEGKVALDVGASTGGFTDCLLQHGASRVYAVDVGYGQLDSRLRNDPRVVNLERTNMRLAPDDLLPEQVDMIVADVSFISLTKVMEPSLRFLKPGGEVAALVKPQFEVAPGQTDKGVVRDENLRQQTVDMVVHYLVNEHGMEFIGVIPSRIKGPKGNQEYIIYLRRPEEQRS